MGRIRRLLSKLLLRLGLEDYLSQQLDTLLPEMMQQYLLYRYVVFGDESRLKVAKSAVVNNALFNLQSGGIVIGEYAFFGHNVSVITGTHDYSKLGLERQQAVPPSGRDVQIREGAWIGSNATILGPCIIGEHSVTAAGSLVRGDVPPYTIVAGVPAKTIGKIDHNR